MTRRLRNWPEGSSTAIASCRLDATSIDVEFARSYRCGVGLREIDNRLFGMRGIGWIALAAAIFFGVSAILTGVTVHPVFTVIYTGASVWCSYWGAVRLRARRVRRSE